MKRQLVNERKRLLSSVEKLLEGPMVFLGFVWLLLLVIELVRGLTPALNIISLTIWGLFIIDFLLKFFLAPEKTVFLKANWLTAVSLVIPALRLLRILRILRLLRGVRVVKVVASLNRSMKRTMTTMAAHQMPCENERYSKLRFQAMNAAGTTTDS
mgnify:CR=1 FL=1